MSLISHQPQGCYATVCSTPISCSKEVKLKPFVALRVFEGLDRSSSWKHQICLSTRSPVFLRPKVKHLKISAFKGTSKNDESGCISSRSKVSKKSIKLSHVPHKGGEEITMDSPEINESPLSYSSRVEETKAGSQAIQNLFRRWLMMLRTQSSNQAADVIFGDEPPQSETSESQIVSPKQERSKILNVVWRSFLGLDASIRIPILMLIPSYLAINVVYGANVSKELNPLWIFGPLVVALYIKMMQWTFALYAYTFKQIARVVKNLPTYYHQAYSYVSEGKLKEELLTRFWRPVIELKNADYKEQSKRKYKELEAWAVEKYLDFIEMIWPFYCRTIRFLKKANFI